MQGGAEYLSLANGQAAHSMELDDTFLGGSIDTDWISLMAPPYCNSHRSRHG
jgi:hypothetical protein